MQISWIFKIFGYCQNHQNQTFKRPYQPKKSWFKNKFYSKINTIMLLYLYQIFIFLLGHLHFFLHFLFMSMENLFKKHPIHVPIFSPQKCFTCFEYRGAYQRFGDSNPGTTYLMLLPTRKSNDISTTKLWKSVSLQHKNQIFKKDSWMWVRYYGKKSWNWD